MTVRLEIKPEIEASLNAQAAAKGIPLDAYLQDAIEDLARAPAAPAANL
jgi:predicted HicB family RNase H-like nuclease